MVWLRGKPGASGRGVGEPARPSRWRCDIAVSMCFDGGCGVVGFCCSVQKRRRHRHRGWTLRLAPHPRCFRGLLRSSLRPLLASAWPPFPSSDTKPRLGIVEAVGYSEARTARCPPPRVPNGPPAPVGFPPRFVLRRGGRESGFAWWLAGRGADWRVG